MKSKYFPDFYKNLSRDAMLQCKDSARRFIPQGRKMQAELGVTPVRSGVMMLCYPENDDLMIVFIRRTKDNGVHSGQIAFPGGRFDEAAGDKNTCDTAIRETFEEIGVEIRRQQIIRAMAPLYIPPSNYLVDPYLAYIDALPNVTANTTEVDEIIILPVFKLLDENSITESCFSTIYGDISAPCYGVDNIKIWGATAIMLSELICIERVRRGIEISN
jgi:8-oxo-dGTP pyrophosphatase MutT (NUDIX family)